MSLFTIESNPYAQWCFERLKGRLASRPNTPDAYTLKLVQNPLIYYAVLGVKRCGVEMSTASRHREVAKTYKSFVVKGALTWLCREGGIARLPDWLTEDMLGKTTLSGELLLVSTSRRSFFYRYTVRGIKTFLLRSITYFQGRQP